MACRDQRGPQLETQARAGNAVSPFPIQKPFSAAPGVGGYSAAELCLCFQDQVCNCVSECL